MNRGRGTTERHARGLAAGLGVAALVLAGFLGGKIVTAQEKKPAFGDLEVTIRVEGGKTAKECAVYAKNKKAIARSGETVKLITGVPAGFTAVTADARVERGWFRADMRYVGVQPVTVMEGKKASVTVTLKPVEAEEGKSINDFCRGCHPTKDEEVKPGQIVRDLHTSGRPLPDKFLPQVKAHNEKVKKMNKEGKYTMFPLLTEERQIIENGKKIKKMYYTCESCHTLHYQVPGTRYTAYVIAPFKDGSDLCLGCHI